MTNQKKKNDWSNIDSLADLQQAQRSLRAEIRMQEKELRGRVKQVPGELLAAGANAIVPHFLSGKITDSAIGFGRNLVNKIFSKKEDGSAGSPLLGAAAKMGLFALLRVGFNAFMNRKKDKE
ncbi:MAG: hypothetical protein JST39_14960 [Bacteroidetes bacterium]|nr:hypothetical protein [Bacteroidota bacterium]